MPGDTTKSVLCWQPLRNSASKKSCLFPRHLPSGGYPRTHHKPFPNRKLPRFHSPPNATPSFLASKILVALWRHFSQTQLFPTHTHGNQKLINFTVVYHCLPRTFGDQKIFNDEVQEMPDDTSKSVLLVPR
jgi:hypothetical protein